MDDASFYAASLFPTNDESQRFPFKSPAIWRSTTPLGSDGGVTITDPLIDKTTSPLVRDKEKSPYTEPTYEIIQQILNWQKIIIDVIDRRGALGIDKTVQLAVVFGRVGGWIRQMNSINQDLCVFCRNNNETYDVYSSHKVKDYMGRVTCPALRNYVCPLCLATGDKAHTVRYCRRNLLTNNPELAAGMPALEKPLPIHPWPTLVNQSASSRSPVVGFAPSLLQPAFMKENGSGGLIN